MLGPTRQASRGGPDDQQAAEQGGTVSLGDVANVGGKALGDRFNLVNVVPATVPAAVLLVLIRGGAYSGGFTWSEAIPDLGAITGGGAVLFVLGVLMLGVVLSPFQVGLVRILEGYWGDSRLAVQLADMGVEVQRRRLAATLAALNIGTTEVSGTSLASQARSESARRRATAKAVSAARRRGRFPDEALLLPTALGNVLRAAETSAGERYGLGTVTVFPRLRQVLSPRLDSSLAQLLTQLDTSAALCISFAISAGFSAPLLTQGWLALVPIGFLALAVLSYRGAETAAAYHGRLLDVAFDLHRFDLIQALHYRVPGTPHAELAFNRRLTEFLSSRRAAADAMPDDPYDHVSGPPESADTVEGNDTGDSQNP